MAVFCMYISKISAENVGPIEKATIMFPFNDDGSPKPVVIVGENGTGKTTLLSHIVDSFYETAQTAFSDVTRSDGSSGYQYYKAITPAEIHFGKKYLFSFIEYESPHNPSYKIGYVFKSGNLSDSSFKKSSGFSLAQQVSWEDEENSKKVFITKEQANTIFGRNVICYFGPDRYEKPAWMGKRYHEREEYEHPSVKERWSGRLQKPILVRDTTNLTLQWLLDVIADSRCDIAQKESGLQVAHINVPDLLQQGTARTNVEKIMSEILGKDVYFGLNLRNRSRSRFNIRAKSDNAILVPSLDALSTGQSALFNMFATIVRYADDNDIYNSITLSNISGIVVIDEAELHLHSNLQREILPRLFKLFPKIQFVITTHSPLFLLGMDEQYGTDGYEIYQMPDCTVISSERFSEFHKAYSYYTQTQTHHEEIQKAIAVKTVNPLIVTEGATDWKHLKAAFANLKSLPDLAEKYSSLDFDFLEYLPKQDTSSAPLKLEMGNAQLVEMCKNCAAISQPRKLIFIADADDKNTNKQLGANSGNFKYWGNNVYSFILPVPQHRLDTPQICIEHYYKDTELKIPVTINGIDRRIYMGNEFDAVGLSTDLMYLCYDRNSCGPDKIRIIDGTSEKRVIKITDPLKFNLALPKMEFANRILDGDPAFAKVDFSNFRSVFDIIKEILDDSG